MVTKTKKPEKATEFPDPPMYFADQPAALMLGPLVSRITFGTEEMDDGPYPRPTVTVAMPTVALVQFVNDLKAALDDPDFKRNTIEQLGRAAQVIRDGGATPEDQKVRIKRRVKNLPSPSK